MISFDFLKTGSQKGVDARETRRKNPVKAQGVTAMTKDALKSSREDVWVL